MAAQNMPFIPVHIAVMTVSDRRTAAEDTSGDWLQMAAEQCGHQVVQRVLCKDNRYQIRASVSQWIADEQIQVILINGGTGFTAGDNTPEAIQPLLDREVSGFGELFRQLSWQEIGSSALQSRALAGMANQTLIFAMPGSPSACKMAWEHLIAPQLDARQRPCHFISHLK